MRLNNRICGKGFEEISDQIQKIFDSAESPLQAKSSFIYLIKNVKDQKTKNVEEQKIYGLIEVPATVYNECDEGDNMIYIKTINNGFFKSEKGHWTTVKGHIFLPNTSVIIDVAKYDKGEETIPKGENVVKMYIGDSAIEQLEKTNFKNT